MVLAGISGIQSGGPWVPEFRRQAGLPDDVLLNSRVEELTTYFLSCAVQRARTFILQKTPDFDEALGDRLMVNMSVPVAHLQNEAIAGAFERCLRSACLLARETNPMRLPAEEVHNAIKRCVAEPRQDDGRYLYPEVSANVQSYIKSRAGTDGLYLFIDVGAGTVDLSIFIVYRHPINDRPISYFSAGVVPLGSSQIEIRTAQKLNQLPDFQRTETTSAAIDPKGHILELQAIVRRVKEGQQASHEGIKREMNAVQKALEQEVLDQSWPILGEARSKIRPHQWHNLKVLIGGGGAHTPLYRNAVNRWFEQADHLQPEPRPIPLPSDLRWPSNIPEASRAKLFARFSVAYGLSFDRANLEDHRTPDEIAPLPPRESPPKGHEPPTMEEC